MVGDDWILKFYNTLSDLNEKTPPIAQSKEFSIKPAGTKPQSVEPPKNNPPKNDSNHISAFSSSHLLVFLVSLVSLLIYF